MNNCLCLNFIRGSMTAFLMPCALSVSAQSEILEDTLKEAQVVAVKLSKETVSAVPLQTVNSVDWLRQGTVDMGQALRKMAGVNLRDYGGAGGLKTVSVRGMGAAHTTVCYDGIPLTDTRQGQIDLSRFSVHRLEGLTLAVADAPDLLCPVRSLGAATLFLHSGNRHSVERFSGKASLRQGSFGMLNPSVDFSTPVGVHSSAGASVDFYYADNDYPFTLNNGSLQTREHRSNSRMQSWTAEADFAHRSSSWGNWQAKVYYRNHHQRLPGQVMLYTKKGTERLVEQVAFGQWGWNFAKNHWKWMLAGKWGWQESLYADIDPQYPSGALRQNYWQREGYVTAGVERSLGTLRVAYAADYLYHSLNSNLSTRNQASRHTLLQSLSAQYAFGRLQATARIVGHVDWNRCYGETAVSNARCFSPSLAISWKLLSGQGYRRSSYLFARLYGKEFMRVPTFTESYYYHLGSQQLRPELTRQLGIGLTFQTCMTSWWPSLSATLDGYYNRITDRITAIPYNLFVWQMVNLGKVRAAGVDFTLQSRFRPAVGPELFLDGNYTWQHAADRTDPSQRSYNCQPAYLPRHSGSLSIAYENPWINASVGVTSVSERWSTNEHSPGTRLPGYAEWSCGLYRDISLGATRLQARVDAVNIFDRQYEVIRRYPMPGRHYRLSISIDF